MSAVAHLFSGGVDSTLAASVLAERFREVHLLTFRRAGFLAEEKSLVRLERLRDRHPGAQITHRFLDVGPFFEELCGGWEDLRRHGVLALAPCGVCKVSMHWRLLLYCLEHGLRHASDGAAAGAEEYAEQNPRILMPGIVAFYREFGVEKVSPAFRPDQSNEEALYRRGISESPTIKRTAQDDQILCSQQVLFAMTMRVYLAGHTFPEYEDAQRRYLGEALSRATALTHEFVKGGKTGRVRELLERAVCA